MYTCKNCGFLYNLKNLKRSLGETAMPVLMGCCSAKCYTDLILTDLPSGTTIVTTVERFNDDTGRWSKDYVKDTHTADQGGVLTHFRGIVRNFSYDLVSASYDEKTNVGRVVTQHTAGSSTREVYKISE